MGIKCCYGTCTSRIRSLKCKVKGAEGIFFVKFPSKKGDSERCKKWVLACGRMNFTVESLDKSSYICSRHFLGFNGPTEENPDPIPLIQVLTPEDLEVKPNVVEPQKRILKKHRSSSHLVRVFVKSKCMQHKLFSL